MVKCCGGGKSEDENKKFEKGGANDFSDGLVKKRGCTDILCLFLWLASVAVYFVVTFLGVQDGDPWKLVQPRDFKGDYCGVNKQWNGGQSLEGHDKLIYLMNVTATVDTIAKQMVCTDAAENALSSIMTAVEIEEYRCNCCKSACQSCEGAFTMEDTSSAADLSNMVTARISELTDPSKTKQLFSGGSANGDAFSSMWKEATKFFVTVCTTDCDVIFQNTTRHYVYSPSPDAPWKGAWDILATNPSVPQAMRNTINDKFKFGALPSSLCPYEPKYCVPFPGLQYIDTKSVCMFSLSPEIASQMGESASTAMQGAQAAMQGASEDFGDLVGAFLDVLDTFFITAVFAFVCGLVFLILLRFIVGIVVWGSLFAVFGIFAGGGLALYIKSGQCKGVSVSNMGLAMGSSLATTAMNSASGDTMSETTTNKYQDDYRGGQHKTITNRLCQRWDEQSPHAHATTAARFPNSGLVDNYCRNPNASAPTIWCFTVDPQKRWEQCSPLTIGLPSCPAGFEIASESTRYWLTVCAYILWVLAGIWIFIIICLQSRIRLAVALNKVAASFIIQTPSVVFVPLVQVFVGLTWCVCWGVSAMFLLSQVPDNYTPTTAYATYAEAYGTSDTPGKCNDAWPTGFVYKYEGDLLSTNDPCSGNMGDISGLVGGPKCWKCYPPRYVLGTKFAVSFFCYLWNNALLVAIGQCVIAGACGIWFFTPNKMKGKTGKSPVGKAIKMVFRYHLGSLAFGAFILALVQFIRYFMKYLEKQAKAQKNKVMVMVLKCVQCLLWCFEKCIQFLNKNAYIQIALVGKNFCSSAKAAFYLIMRNMLRFGAVAMLGGIIQFIGFMFIFLATTAVGYIVLMLIHPSTSPLIPILSYAALGWLSAKLFMSVFGLSVDTALQCFIAVEEMGEDASVECIPKSLQKLCPKASKEAWKEGEEGNEEKK